MLFHNNIASMTEKEKAAQGLLYDANFNQELLNDRKRAKELIYRYNLLSPTQETERLSYSINC